MEGEFWYPNVFRAQNDFVGTVKCSGLLLVLLPHGEVDQCIEKIFFRSLRCPHGINGLFQSLELQRGQSDGVRGRKLYTGRYVVLYRAINRGLVRQKRWFKGRIGEGTVYGTLVIAHENVKSVQVNWGFCF